MFQPLRDIYASFYSQFVLILILIMSKRDIEEKMFQLNNSDDLEIPLSYTFHPNFLIQTERDS